MTQSRYFVAIMSIALPAAAVFGQAFNIDFGVAGAGPSDTYGGAGLAGYWNSIEGEHTPFTAPEVIYELLDINGEPTDVTLYQFGGTELIDAADPSVTGDDSILLNDALITHSAGLESCLFINGLQPGTYEVITYAWMPEHAETLSKVRHDFTPEQALVGGAWSGVHEQGITYALHFVEVTASGFMGSHSGIPPGGDLVIGAAMNGIQLRLMQDCESDLNGDGSVNAADLAVLLGAWGDCAVVTCPADLDGDQVVGAADLAALLGSWGPCPR